MIKRFSIQIIIRILLLLGTCLLLAYFFNRSMWFSFSGTSVFIVFQVYSLINYVNETNYSLTRFMEALKSEDHSVYFSASKKGKSFARLFKDFNTIISIFKKNKIEKDAQHIHFQQILEHINLGVISINKEDLDSELSQYEIRFFNKAASNILEQPRHKYWHRLSRQMPWFKNEIIKIADGGKSLVDIEIESVRKQLSINVMNVKLLDIHYLIISFQDIHSEIEQKEIEAWHNVIRVLAHEMLNSFTPISSLASTIKSMTENSKGIIMKHDDIKDEIIKDINLAASTINKRSDGLMEFVNDYRTISNVPIPKIAESNIKVFLEGIHLLMKSSFEKNNILFIPPLVPSKATFFVDEKMIEQVFINLIGNSIYALKGVEDPTIRITCELKERQTIVTVKDNGKGIPSEILDKIFIPFFTTRKNGSGIGLSLSKNIMKQHNGQLRIKSQEGVFTTFFLVFNHPGSN